MNEYEYGAKVVIPNMLTNEAQVLTFKGSFGVRKLRKMLRKCLYINEKRHLDLIIKEYTVKLKPVTMDQLIAAVSDEKA